MPCPKCQSPDDPRAAAGTPTRSDRPAVRRS